MEEITINYEKALEEAEKLAKEIIEKYPFLSYNVYLWSGDGTGAYIELFGEDDELVMDISEAFGDRKLELLLSGAPVYIVYGGNKENGQRG